MAQASVFYLPFVLIGANQQKKLQTALISAVYLHHCAGCDRRNVLRTACPTRSPNTSIAGVNNSVRMVANARPPAIALESCAHHWVDGAPSPREGVSRSTFTLSTIGISPSTVVTAVSNTGRKRRQLVSSAAS